MAWDYSTQKDPLEIRKDKIEDQMAKKANDILNARRDSNYKWPKQLTSGVMFYNGSRITKEEFLNEKEI